MEKAIMLEFLNKKTRYKWDSLFGLGRLLSLEEFEYYGVVEPLVRLIESKCSDGTEPL